MKITIRQWRYIASRLQSYPIEILNELNTNHYNCLPYQYINLDLLIRDRLQLSLADLLTETENALTVTEMSELIGINRYLFHYRYKAYRVKPITTFPFVYFNIHDAWKMIGRYDLARYFKANPIYKWRVSNHYSLFQAARKLKLSRLQLTILESKGLHPSIYNDLKPNRSKPANNKIVDSLARTFADIPQDKNRVQPGTTTKKVKNNTKVGAASSVTNKLSNLRRAITRHCGAATLTALLRWQRKKIR